jgi:hypothetical protein
MSAADRVVARLLSYLEERIDLDHVAQATIRQKAALDYVALDRPPITFYLPYEGTDFAPYPYPEAFADPAKMTVNELLIGFTAIYHAVDLRDDAPYCLRANLGTGLIASMFGAEIRLVEDNPPWVMPLGGLDHIRKLVERALPDVRSVLGQRAMDQYAYFQEAVARYPRCQAAFHFTLPDLQGPFSIAELLWGSQIYFELYDHPDLVRQLLDRITTQIVRTYQAFVRLTTDARDVPERGLGAGYCYQHAVATKGHMLVRNDSMVNLSPGLYRDFVLPFDARLSQELGGIGVHYCGKGEHQVDNLLQIPGLGCLDLGNPEMNALDGLYAQAAPRRVALTRLSVPAEELRAPLLQQRFPTGVILVHAPKTVSQAHALLDHYLCKT